MLNRISMMMMMLKQDAMSKETNNRLDSHKVLLVDERRDAWNNSIENDDNPLDYNVEYEKRAFGNVVDLP